MLALDRRFGFASAVAVLMLVQVLALDRFGFAGAAAVLMLVQVMQVQVLVLDRRFVWPVLVPCLCWCRRWLWIGASFCVMPGMT